MDSDAIIYAKVGETTIYTSRDTVYARAGERVTCENGHHIFTFCRTVRMGEDVDPPKNMEDWQIPVPPIGAVDPPCHCGAQWAACDGRFHFERGGWR